MEKQNENDINKVSTYLYVYMHTFPTPYKPPTLSSKISNKFLSCSILMLIFMNILFFLSLLLVWISDDVLLEEEGQVQLPCDINDV